MVSSILDSFYLLRLVAGNRAQRGGALFSTDLSNSTISSCTFGDNNAAAAGAAISAYNRSLTLLSNSTIHRENSARAIFVCFVYSPYQIKSRCLGNSAEQGGGINVEDSTFSALECNLTQNRADFQGGAIRGSRSSVEIYHSRVSRSRSRDGAGLHTFRMNLIHVEYVVFEDNSGEEEGGALRVEFSGTTASISNCSFLRNEAGDGSSVYLLGTQMQIMDSRFESNSANRRGAALYMDESNVTVQQTEISSNSAMSYVGICALGRSQLVGEGMSVLSNTASEDGGGIGIDEESSLRCRECEFKNNVARRGAGMFVNSNDSQLIVAQLQDSRFQGNNASSFGGKFFSPCTISRFFCL